MITNRYKIINTVINRSYLFHLQKLSHSFLPPMLIRNTMTWYNLWYIQHPYQTKMTMIIKKLTTRKLHMAWGTHNRIKGCKRINMISFLMCKCTIPGIIWVIQKHMPKLYIFSWLGVLLKQVLKWWNSRSRSVEWYYAAIYSQHIQSSRCQ